MRSSSPRPITPAEWWSETQCGRPIHIRREHRGRWCRDQPPAAIRTNEEGAEGGTEILPPGVARTRKASSISQKFLGNARPSRPILRSSRRSPPTNATPRQPNPGSVSSTHCCRSGDGIHPSGSARTRCALSSPPTTVIWGDHDTLGGPYDVRDGVMLFEEVRFETVATGHIPYLAHPDRYAELIIEEGN